MQCRRRRSIEFIRIRTRRAYTRDITHTESTFGRSILLLLLLLCTRYYYAIRMITAVISLFLSLSVCSAAATVDGHRASGDITLKNHSHIIIIIVVTTRARTIVFTYTSCTRETDRLADNVYVRLVWSCGVVEMLSFFPISYTRKRHA